MQNNLLKKVSLMIAILMMVLLITGCNIGDNNLPDLSDRYVVIYDGNGGVLGNKTFTTRKLLVKPGSKIPRYVQDYADTDKDDPYIISSLGVATRDGYKLLGWYREQDASYELDQYGKFVKLDVAAGNGIYNLNDEGNYVMKYNPDESGEYVYLTIEDAPLSALPSLKYVYYESSNGYGLYIYDENDVNHREAYEKIENQFTLEEIQENIGSTSTYYVYEYLEEHFAELDEVDPKSNETYNKYKNILKNASRYTLVISEYTEADAGLDRYNLETGFVEVDAMMEERKNGNYVFLNDEYVLYDPADPDHQGLTRFQIGPRYVFTTNGAIDSPSKMDKYAITIKYWDFEKDVVNEDMILKAHWVKKCTVEFTWINASGNYETRTLTSKVDKNDLTKIIDFTNGQTIGKLSLIPNRPGYTFLGWSKSETEFIPWDFENDVFPMGTDTMKLYGYMIEGTYKVISTAEELRTVAQDPTKNYVLVNDIDLNGQVFRNTSPLGFVFNKANDVAEFTGEFLGLGYSIKNFKMVVENDNATLGHKKVLALFPRTKDAKITDLKVENCVLEIDNSRNNPSDLGIAALIGEALEGTTVINNVSLEVTYQVVNSSKTLNCKVYVGDVVAVGVENCQIASTTSTYTGKATVEAVVDPANLFWQLLN